MKSSLILLFVSTILLFSLSQCNYNSMGCEGNCSGGFGVERWRDGGYQTGHWKNGKMIGYGKQHFGSTSKFAGDTYIGGFDTNGYCGYGVYYGKNQNFIHIGYFKDAMPNGYGIVRFGSNSASPNRYYGGWWKDGKYDGYGVLSTESIGTHINVKYVGYWSNGLMEGNGVYSWPDGSRYEGHFSNDLFDGEATFIFSDGLKYKGMWHEGHNSDFMKIVAMHYNVTNGRDSILIAFFAGDSTNLKYFKNLIIK